MCSDLIDDITDHADTTNTRLIKETRHIKIVDRKSGSCGKFTTFWSAMLTAD